MFVRNWRVYSDFLASTRNNKHLAQTCYPMQKIKKMKIQNVHNELSGKMMLYITNTITEMGKLEG